MNLLFFNQNSMKLNIKSKHLLVHQPSVGLHRRRWAPTSPHSTKRSHLKNRRTWRRRYVPEKSSDIDHFLLSLSLQALIDRLDTYFEDPSLINKNRLNIVSLPPPLQPIPCKPVLFDLALNHLTFPSLDDKVQSKRAPTSGQADKGQQQQQAGLSGFVKGLFSWSGNKQ